MTQNEINQKEWDNLENWSHPTFGIYFSKRDSRIWVPKRVPSFGRTINMGHPAGMWWLVALITVPALIAGLAARRRG